MEKPRPRAALYFRQSLDVQEGIDRQRARCTALAEAKDWIITGEYEDNDTSASKSRKAGTAWARLLDDARDKKFEVVIAVDLDRLLRRVSDLVTLTETGAKVLTVDGEIDLTTADGEFRATMLAGIAQFETRRKGERQIRANAHAASLGHRRGGRRPFGYEADGITIREDEAQAVRDGFRDFLMGMPIAAIARDWNERGFFTGVTRYKEGVRGDASPWTTSGIRQVLLNARYMGKRSHNGEIVADAVWPGIVDESTWLSANAKLKDPSRRHAPTRGRYLLSSLAVCSICGATAKAGSNGTQRVAGYRCSGARGHFARRAQPVDDYVQAVIVARLSRPDARDLLRSAPHSDGPALALEAVGLRTRLDALAIAFADGDITVSQFRKGTERMRETLATVESKMVDAGKVSAFGDLISANDVQTAWDGLRTEKKRAVIAALAQIVIYPPGRGTRNFDPESVGIEWIS